MKLTLVGGALGLVAATALNRLLGRMVLGVEAASPTLMAGLTLILVLTSGLAALLQAVRAARVDPMEAFRD